MNWYWEGTTFRKSPFRERLDGDLKKVELTRNERECKSRNLYDKREEFYNKTKKKRIELRRVKSRV